MTLLFKELAAACPPIFTRKPTFSRIVPVLRKRPLPRDPPLQKVVMVCKIKSTFLINHLHAVSAHGVLIIITPDLVMELVTQGQEPPQSEVAVCYTSPCLSLPDAPRKAIWQRWRGTAVTTPKRTPCLHQLHAVTHTHTHTQTRTL